MARPPAGGPARPRPWEGSIARLEAQHRGLVDALLDLRLEYGDAAVPRYCSALASPRTRTTSSSGRQLVDALLGRGPDRRGASGVRRRPSRPWPTSSDIEPGPELEAAGARAENGRSANWPNPASPRPPADRPEPAAQPGPMAAPELTDPQRPPSQLPLDLADFSGRQDQLEQLRDLVCGRTRCGRRSRSSPARLGPGRPRWRSGSATWSGSPSRTGRSTWTCTARPSRAIPAAALTDLLLSLNLPDYAIPTDPERRSAMLRSELASRRVLIILDDVATAAR